MQLTDKVVVITGGGSGIGRALSQRVAREKPAGIAVADLNGEAAEAAADELGSLGLGVRCDVTVEDDLKALLERTRKQFGPVDVFFANAGVAIGEDEQTPDEVWDRAFAVNIRSHITAARLLVPEWLERGAGCFVATASAAGVLTQIGGAPYAVTKHAAVAFAEWLSVTYGDRGIHVSCICPMGVDTPMLMAPGEHGSGLAGAAVQSVITSGEVLSAADAAEAIVQGLAEDRFLILPHPVVLEYFRRKTADYDRWLSGMRRLRRTVESPV
jgi:NAD(P)-dependent dehydrogenase (short-subunit alcohol dehydrogenase family)